MMKDNSMFNTGDSVSQGLTVGKQLKRAREQKQQTIQEVAAAVFLPERHLTALESDDFVQLPEPTYVKGYIRSYAKYLGLINADELIRRYAEQNELSASENTASGLSPLHTIKTSTASVTADALEVATDFRVRKQESVLSNYIKPLLVFGMTLLVGSIVAFLPWGKWLEGGYFQAGVAATNQRHEPQLPTPPTKTDAGSATGVDSSSTGSAATMLPSVSTEASVAQQPLTQSVQSSTGFPQATNTSDANTTVSNTSSYKPAVQGANAIDASTNSALSKQANPTPHSDTLHFGFSKETDVTVFDEGGNVLVSGPQPKDTPLAVSGKSPFQVIINDNAEDVQMHLNNTQINLKPYIKNHTAELRIAP